MEKREHIESCTIKNACPECGGDVHDGTGTGWEVCKNLECNWMG